MWQEQLLNSAALSSASAKRDGWAKGSAVRQRHGHRCCKEWTAVRRNSHAKDVWLVRTTAELVVQAAAQGLWFMATHDSYTVQNAARCIHEALHIQ